MNTNDIIGTIGVGIILLAYFLQTFKLVKTGALFYTLNALGAGIACYASYLISYYPFVLLEAVWCLVSVFGLIKLSYGRHQ